MYSLTKHRIHVLIKIVKTSWKITQASNRVYLHVTFGGIFTIQQGLISCPLHGKTTLKILNITLWNSSKIIGSDWSKTVIFKVVLVYAWLIFSSGSHPRFHDQNQEDISITTTIIVKDHQTERYVVPPPPPLFLDYLSLSFINIFLLHISGHSEVCHFTRFLLSNQHITGRKVSVNDLRKNWCNSEN